MPTERKVWAGFDLGGTKMLAVVFDGKFAVLGREKAKVRGADGAKAGVARILEALHAALAKAGLPPTALAGVGVAVPGPIHPRKGLVIEMPNLGWSNLALAEVLSSELGCPVRLVNDVDAGVYGEYRFGAGQGGRCVLGVFPGTGVGGGCVYEDNLLQGAQRSCLEIGHIRVLPNGPRCGCGGRGCLETVASRLAIAQAVAAAAYRGDAPTILRKAGTDLREIRSGLLADAVRAGEASVIAILNDAAHWLGIGVAAAVNLLNPDIVVLGGGLVEALPELFLQGVRESVEAHAMRAFRETYRIVPAKLGDDATAQGAAAWAQRQQEREA